MWCNHCTSYSSHCTPSWCPAINGTVLLTSGHVAVVSKAQRLLLDRIRNNLCGVIFAAAAVQDARPASTADEREFPSCFAIKPTTCYVMDIHDGSRVQLLSHDGTVRAPTNVIGADWTAIFRVQSSTLCMKEKRDERGEIPSKPHRHVVACAAGLFLSLHAHVRRAEGVLKLNAPQIYKKAFTEGGDGTNPSGPRAAQKARTSMTSGELLIEF